MKIDTRKLRKALNAMIDELDKQPQVKKDFGNVLRDVNYGIGSVGNYQVNLELIEWDCPVSEFVPHVEVVSGERD